MRSIVVEGGRRKRYNRINDCIDVAKDVGCTHPEHPEPVLFHKPISQIVPCRHRYSIVRLAVHFNNQSLTKTAKIGDI